MAAANLDPDGKVTLPDVTAQFVGASTWRRMLYPARGRRRSKRRSDCATCGWRGKADPPESGELVEGAEY